MRKAIDSVLAQNFAGFELVVVDDGSTDDTAQIIRESYDGRVKYIFQSNRGVSIARNVGIECARGKWLAFLDSDDEWSPDYLEKQVRYLKVASPQQTMQAANCRFVSLKKEVVSYFDINKCIDNFKTQEHLVIEKPFRFILEHAPWQLGSTIILRSAALKTGLFDRNLTISEDLDVMARVSVLGSFGLIKEELVQIHRREENIECLTNQSSAQPIRARESLELIYEKLKQLPLDHEERSALNALLGANRRAMGNFLLDAGDTHQARESYRRAFLYDQSLRSIGRYVLSFLPH